MARGKNENAAASALAADVQAQKPLLAELPFDAYDIEVMDRRLLHGADYNPRIMSDESRKRLKIIVKKHGLLAPPVWNKRSVEKGWPEGSAGVVVGGHQRLSVMDAIQGNDRYTLKVAVVDKTPTEEREANLALNNPEAQGDWDLERLELLLRDPGLDIAGTGFDMGGVIRLFGDLPGAAQPEVEELAKRLHDFQEAYAKISDNLGRDDFYVVAVFRDYTTRKQFLEALHLSDNRYQCGATLLEKLNETSDLRATGPAHV